MLTRRKTLFRSLPYSVRHIHRILNAQMLRNNNAMCIVCTAILLCIQFFIFAVFHFLFSLPFRFVRFSLFAFDSGVLIFFQYYESTSRDKVYKMRRSGVSVIVILLYYYVLCVSFSTYISFSFRFVSFVSHHPIYICVSLSASFSYCAQSFYFSLLSFSLSPSTFFFFSIRNSSPFYAIQCVLICPRYFLRAGFILRI